MTHWHSSPMVSHVKQQFVGHTKQTKQNHKGLVAQFNMNILNLIKVSRDTQPFKVRSVCLVVQWLIQLPHDNTLRVHDPLTILTLGELYQTAIYGSYKINKTKNKNALVVKFICGCESAQRKKVNPLQIIQLKCQHMCYETGTDIIYSF